MARGRSTPTWRCARSRCGGSTSDAGSNVSSTRSACCGSSRTTIRTRRPRCRDGSTLAGDVYVFACGPWLGKLFPEVIGDRVRATRQEVFFFGTPPGDARFTEEALPVWADHANHFMYGIPGNEWRGFKVADDARGPAFDPTAGERVPSPEALRSARDYLAYRFPGLKDAPLVEARVCQYENSPDEHFIVDRHPRADHVWLVGGGSGHGFK